MEPMNYLIATTLKHICCEGIKNENANVSVN